MTQRFSAAEKHAGEPVFSYIARLAKAGDGLNFSRLAVC